MSQVLKFRIQAGSLVFELEGPRDLVEQQLHQHREHIDMILAEQARIIKSGKLLRIIGAGRRGRPPKAPRAATERGLRPGRQPVIIRDSSLQLKPRQQAQLRKYLQALAGEGQLGKDASVFAIAWFLCTEVLNQDHFSAGDVIVALHQLGPMPFVPDAGTVDVVQMLRNLAAASIGKEWVARRADGTFALTEKGREVGQSGQIVRPRGRRPAQPVALGEDNHHSRGSARPARVRKRSSEES